MKKILSLLVVGTLSFLGGVPDAAAVPPVNTGWFSDVAVKGYDVVAYHTDGKPVKGSDAFEVKWKGATWRFASEEHRKMFEQEPEKYAPAYGGYCAWAVAEGSTADIDPEAWKIVDGTLYLNYNRKIQKRWNEDIPGNIQRANEHWPKLSD